MITKQLKVIYTGFDSKLDDKIIKALEQVGFTWFTQGKNSLTNERDIQFDYEVEEK